MGRQGAAEHAGAVHVGSAPQGNLTAEEHHEWAQKLWSRIDRDHSGEVTREELNCNEFQDVLRSVIAPDTVGKNIATYGRSSQNIDQAINFCMRKADCNNSGKLSFEEFKGFLRAIRNQTSAKSSALMIFALFDLDGTQTIDQDEFREIYRYFLGHHPTAVEFEQEWFRLDTGGSGEVTQKQYVKWLQTSTNPIFKQHAPPIEDRSADAQNRRVSLQDSQFDLSSGNVGSQAQEHGGKGLGKGHRPAPGVMPRIKRNTGFAMPWNQRFNAKDIYQINKEAPQERRIYFSKPQSLPELKRFYNTHQGFDKHRRRVNMTLPPEPKPILSSTSLTELRLPGQSRHQPGGSMLDKKGEVVHWQELTPRAQKKVVIERGSLSLRVSGPPPPTLMLGRDAPEED
eukprot:gnl/TRDRNA2_/TRDRNA2_188553_c0_seq1.p1 gnl/TRDRNA2_/TRDRNA2_188553_c0~~gnl/TRDRNA2_/TRDRNA2_188553_c0_seq1.p1  ORF type:complete len:398 (-),score=71.96 gnl/TRDRNA2_/TRDRNA2_188553_c0_seq1:65-1258(-)